MFRGVQGCKRVYGLGFFWAGDLRCQGVAGMSNIQSLNPGSWFRAGFRV